MIGTKSNIILDDFTKLAHCALMVHKILKSWVTLNQTIDKFGMQITTNILGTGAVVGFLATREKQSWLRDYAISVDNYFNKSYGSATLLLLAFFCSFILSVISSYALPKKIQ